MKIKPSQAVLNALGLHAAVPPPPTSSSTFALHPPGTAPYPGSLFGSRTSTYNLLHLLRIPTVAVAAAPAPAPAVIIPVLGQYSLIHSALRPRLRFCLSNIFYIKAQPQPLCAHGAFLQNITSPPPRLPDPIAVFIFSEGSL